MKRKVRATMHGAVSIVNAIATGRGSSLGISLKVVAEIEIEKGQGLRIQGKKGNNLVTSVIHNALPRNVLADNFLSISIESEIPSGYGLKSSSAVSNALALACNKIINEDINDYTVLDIAVRSSLDAKVTITGAYDDASACYFGGIVLTNNRTNKLLRRERAPDDVYAIIFLPKNPSRGNVHKLAALSDLFSEALNLAERREYWKAMKLNGVLTSVILGTNYQTVLTAFEKGALAASTSGNGPSVAALAYKEEVESIRSVFSKSSYDILVSKLNNQKASVQEVRG
jgi:shikimate kinase